MRELFGPYSECFPAHPMSERAFFQVLRPDLGRAVGAGIRFHCYASRADAEAAAWAPALCARPRMRSPAKFGAQRLKQRGCASIELRYVALVDGYARLGFRVARCLWMGEKPPAHTI